MTIKVLYILNTTSMGGANISLINLIKGLEHLGIEIYIIHPDKIINSDFYSETKKFVKEYYYVPLKSCVISKTSKKWKHYLKRQQIKLTQRYTEIPKLNRIIKAIRPDIIETNTGVIHSGYIVAKNNNIPHIWHVREYQTRDFNWDIMPSEDMYISMLRDSYVVTITADLLRYFKLADNKKAICIYNGCLSENDICFNKTKEKYFLSCSRVSEEKNIHDVIDAFAIFCKQHSDYTLKIAGFGNEKYVNFLKEKVKKLGIETKVEFLGHVSDVKPLMDYATALVVASRFEGFGRMTAEAAFRGCLTIGRNTGGTKEIIEQTGGFLYDGDCMNLYKEMEKCVSLSEEEIVEKCLMAQLIAKNLFSIENNIKQMHSLYTRILCDEEY